MSVDNHSVNRNLRPRLYHNNVAGDHLINGDFFFHAVFNDDRRLWGESHEFLNRLAGPSFGHGLKGFSQKNKGDDYPRGFKIEGVYRLEIPLGYLPHIVEAVTHRSRSPNGDEGIHVGAPVEEVFEAHRIEPVARDDDRNNQNQFREGIEQREIHRG